MNKFIKTTTLTIAAAAVSVALASGAQAKEWRGWNIHPPEYPVSTGMEEFAKLINEKSGGDLEAKVYHGGVLGDQPDAIQQVRLGGLDSARWVKSPPKPTLSHCLSSSKASMPCMTSWMARLVSRSPMA